MSILIENMEMPKSCVECWNYDKINARADGWCCVLTLTSYGCNPFKRPAWCPLKEIPTTDVKPVVHGEKPVVHGEWIQVVRENIYDEEYRLTRCSVCGFEMNNEVFFEPWDFRYCPNCGAKMDEVEDDG